jgi:hypothetical protein
MPRQSPTSARSLNVTLRIQVFSEIEGKHTMDKDNMKMRLVILTR